MQYEFPLSSSSFAFPVIRSFKLRLADFIYFYCSWPASISFATCGARPVINVYANVIKLSLSKKQKTIVVVDD